MFGKKVKVVVNNGTKVAVVKIVVPIASRMNNVRKEKPKAGWGKQNSTPHYDIHTKLKSGNDN